MSVSEAREVCQHWWMKEALERLVNRKLGRVTQIEIVGSIHCIGDGNSDL